MTAEDFRVSAIVHFTPDGERSHRPDEVCPVCEAQIESAKRSGSVVTAVDPALGVVTIGSRGTP